MKLLKVLMLFAFLIAGSIIDADAQTYQIGHISLTFIDSARSNRPVPTEIYYPADVTVERIENYQNNEHVVIEGNSDITIEHIYPQNPDPKWKLELGVEEYNFIKENYLNTIGNLTLSGNNGKLGNKSFTEKREMNVDSKEQGYKFSRLWLNRHLKEITTWNKSEIERRADLISERFLRIWGIPELQVEPETSND